jgi:hypothetical protein
MVARVALEPHQDGVSKSPPDTYTRPLDPGEDLPSIRGAEQISVLHLRWSRRPTFKDSTSIRARLVAKTRGMVERIFRGSDDALLGDLVRAADALAVRCDQLAGRLSSLEVTLSEVASVLGRDVTLLRARVEDLSSDESEQERPSPPRG